MWTSHFQDFVLKVVSDLFLDIFLTDSCGLRSVCYSQLNLTSNHLLSNLKWFWCCSCHLVRLNLSC